MVEDQVIAMAGEAIAQWRSTRDPSVLDLVTNTLALGAELNLTTNLAAVQDVEIEVAVEPWSIRGCSLCSGTQPSRGGALHL